MEPASSSADRTTPALAENVATTSQVTPAASVPNAGGNRPAPLPTSARLANRLRSVPAPRPGVPAISRRLRPKADTAGTRSQKILAPRQAVPAPYPNARLADGYDVSV